MCDSIRSTTYPKYCNSTENHKPAKVPSLQDQERNLLTYLLFAKYFNLFSIVIIDEFTFKRSFHGLTLEPEVPLFSGLSYMLSTNRTP